MIIIWHPKLGGFTPWAIYRIVVFRSKEAHQMHSVHKVTGNWSKRSYDELCTLSDTSGRRPWYSTSKLTEPGDQSKCSSDDLGCRMRFQ